MKELKDRLLKIKDSTVWPNHGAEVLLTDVFIEHLMFKNDASLNGLVTVKIVAENGEGISIDFPDDLSSDVFHKVDVGLWIKTLKVIKFNSSDVLFIKYKTKIHEVIERFEVNGKKIEFVKV